MMPVTPTPILELALPVCQTYHHARRLLVTPVKAPSLLDLTDTRVDLLHPFHAPLPVGESELGGEAFALLDL